MNGAVIHYEKRELMMLKKIVLMMIMTSAVLSCTARKPVQRPDPLKKTVKKTAGLRDLSSGFTGKISAGTREILKDAEKYLGAPYKFAGNTSAGFDCSGLVSKVFDENGVKLPRRSEDQSKTGKEIHVHQVMPGDLLFFATAGGNRVSHVGIVHDVLDNGEINFVHSSTSKGVIISSLNEKYWNQAYLFARRLL